MSIADTLVEQEVVLNGLGGTREVRTGPDKCIYLKTDAPARLLRLEDK